MKTFIKVGAVCCLPALVCAQQASLELPELVVSASRVAVPAGSVGSSVTVIDAEELEQRQDQSVEEVLRSVPGISVSRSGPSGSFTQVRLRGSEANHTLVLIDGVEANDPAISGFDFAHLQASDIARIEVLRGPQSALWGSDAVGGVINIITRRGSGAASGRIAAEAGTHHSWGLRGSAGAGGDGYDVYLSANHSHTGGVSASPIGKEDDGYQNTTLSFKGGLYPSENIDLDVVTRYTNAESETDPQDFSFPPGPTYGLIIDGDNLTELERFYGRAQGRYRMLDGAWEHTAGMAITDTTNRFLDAGVRVNQSEGRKFKLDYQSAYFLDTASASHTFILAAEREKESFQQAGDSPDSPQNQDRDIVNYGLVGEYRLTLGDNLDLSAALRRDDNARFDDATTYRVTGSYALSDTGSRLHGSYGKGVKNPTFTELFGFFPDSFMGNPDLQPETSVGWDVGLEQTFWNGRGLLDITYFSADLEDEILTVFDSQTFLSTVVNGDGDSQRQGVELSLQVSPLPYLDIRAGYTYLDSEDPDGEEEIRRPRHSASLGLNYRFLDDRANLNLTVDYQGERDDLDFGTSPSTRVQLDSYTLIDLAASYQVDPTFRVFGRVQNLLDENYQEVLGYQSLDRTFYLGVEASF